MENAATGISEFSPEWALTQALSWGPEYTSPLSIPKKPLYFCGKEWEEVKIYAHSARRKQIKVQADGDHFRGKEDYQSICDLKLHGWLESDYAGKKEF
jgi:hypothetical protein